MNGCYSGMGQNVHHRFICLALFVQCIALVQSHDGYFKLKSGSEFEASLDTPFPANISSTYKGSWISNSTEVVQGNHNRYQHTSGIVLYRLWTSPTTSPFLHSVEGVMNVRDGEYSSQFDIRLRLRGFYFPKTGEVVLFSDGPTRADAAMLQAIEPSVPPEALSAALEQHEKKAEDSMESNDRFSQCGSVLRLQVQRPSKTVAMPGGPLPHTVNPVPSPNLPDTHGTPPTSTQMISLSNADARSGVGDDQSEDSKLELMRPDMAMFGTVVSSSCQLNATVSASVLRYELYYAKIVNYVVMVTCISLGQISIIMRQMQHTASTPARASKVSLLAIGQQALLDSYLCLFHLTTGIMLEPLFQAFITTSFFEFVIFSLFEMRFLLIIWKARRPDAFNNGWEVMRREFSKLYTRFYGCLIIGLFIIYQARNYLGLLVFVLYSFWIPQIVSNAVQDAKNALSMSYVITISLTRLAIPLYVWGCPRNFFNVQPNPYICSGLILYMALQVIVLLLQDKVDPRFFVPQMFLPEKYNYHRVPVVDIEMENLEDPCPICYCEFEPDAGPSHRMVTPCGHTFHSDCLTRWMEQKMECPSCRGELPSL